MPPRAHSLTASNGRATPPPDPHSTEDQPVAIQALSDAIDQLFRHTSLLLEARAGHLKTALAEMRKIEEDLATALPQLEQKRLPQPGH